MSPKWIQNHPEIRQKGDVKNITKIKQFLCHLGACAWKSRGRPPPLTNPPSHGLIVLMHSTPSSLRKLRCAFRNLAWRGDGKRKDFCSGSNCFECVCVGRLAIISIYRLFDGLDLSIYLLFHSWRYLFGDSSLRGSVDASIHWFLVSAMGPFQFLDSSMCRFIDLANLARNSWTNNHKQPPSISNDH